MVVPFLTHILLRATENWFRVQIGPYSCCSATVYPSILPEQHELRLQWCLEQWRPYNLVLSAGPTSFIVSPIHHIVPIPPVLDKQFMQTEHTTFTITVTRTTAIAQSPLCDIEQIHEFYKPEG